MKRPWGVTIFASVVTVMGGFSCFILLLFIIDSVQRNGLFSLVIYSTTSFVGFVLYGVLPVLYYSTGVGLFQLRAWAYKSALFLLPGGTLAWMIHAIDKLGYQWFLLYIVFFVSFLCYLARRQIRVLFSE